MCHRTQRTSEVTPASPVMWRSGQESGVVCAPDRDQAAPPVRRSGLNANMASHHGSPIQCAQPAAVVDEQLVVERQVALMAEVEEWTFGAPSVVLMQRGDGRDVPPPRHIP